MARAPRTDSSKQRRSRPTPRWLTTKTDLDVVARNRVMLVLTVLSGEKPVTSAIEEAGISRGFYYQLETKALNAMLLALAPGADGDSSPDATGLHARIRQLEDKLAKAEAAGRRSERLLFVQRKLTSSGAVKTHRGRPPKTTTSSTPGGPRGWRSSTTTKPKATRSPRTKSATTAASPAPASTSTPAGEREAPSDGSENSRAPTPRATT
jgi:hypothetical protein